MRLGNATIPVLQEENWHREALVILPGQRKDITWVSPILDSTITIGPSCLPREASRQAEQTSCSIFHLLINTGVDICNLRDVFHFVSLVSDREEPLTLPSYIAFPPCHP